MSTTAAAAHAFYLALLCGGALSTASRRRVFFARPHPPSSLQTCLDALQRPGDECRLHPGRYRPPTLTGSDSSSGSRPFQLRGRRGSAAAPIIVAAVDGADPDDVILDGTVAVGPWHRREDGVFRAALPQPVWQLFDSGRQYQVPARWPDAFWHDRSVFEGPEHWAHSTTGHHNISERSGLLIDAGECANASACCSLCNANGLGSSGINATGALAILNLWSCDTGIERIAQHTPGSNTLHYHASWVTQCDKYRGGLGKYDLEGKEEFLTAETEWHYNIQTREALWIPPSQFRAAARSHGAPPPLAWGRVNDFSLNVSNCSFVTFANFSMFATAMSVDNDQSMASQASSHHLSFESLVLNYTTSNRFVVGDLSPPRGMTVWSGGGEAPSPAPSPGPAPLPPHCSAAVERLCLGLQGRGVDCDSCVINHSQTLEAAGCWAKQKRHEFIVSFCGGGVIRAPAQRNAAPATFMRYVDVQWRYSNGNVLFHKGSSPTFENCLVEETIGRRSEAASQVSSPAARRSASTGQLVALT
jgi:hypothetical protein